MSNRSQPSGHLWPLFQAPPAYPGPAYGAIQGNHPPRPGSNVIDDDETESITNVFCFGAFADKRDGVVKKTT